MCSFGMYWRKEEIEIEDEFVLKEVPTPVEIPADH